MALEHQNCSSKLLVLSWYHLRLVHTKTQLWHASLGTSAQAYSATHKHKVTDAVGQRQLCVHLRDVVQA